MALFVVASCTSSVKLPKLSKSLAEGQAAVSFWAELDGAKCLGIRLRANNERTGSQLTPFRHTVPGEERSGRFKEIPSENGQVFFALVEPGKHRFDTECVAVNVGPTIDGETTVETQAIRYLPPVGKALYFDAKAGEITDLGVISLVSPSDSACKERCIQAVPQQSSQARLNALTERLSKEGLKTRLVQRIPYFGNF